MLPEEIFETKKYLVPNFPGKADRNAKAIAKTYELLIYKYIRHTGKSFCKNMHTDNISTAFKNMSASHHQKYPHFYM